MYHLALLYTPAPECDLFWEVDDCAGTLTSVHLRLFISPFKEHDLLHLVTNVDVKSPAWKCLCVMMMF